MKKLYLLLFWYFFCVFSLQLYGQNNTKIVLSSATLYNISTRGDATLLIDEQELAGDPANGSGGQPETVFSAGWPDANVYYPVQIVLDLGVTRWISDLWYFDTNDADSLFIFTGSPLQWDLQHTLLLNSFNEWKQLEIESHSKYIMLQFRSPASRISEIVLYGSAQGAIPSEPEPVIHPLPRMETFIGVNGFVDDPPDKLRVAGSLREYHNWGWDEGNTDTTYQGYPNNQYAWNPSWVSGPGWGFYFDDFYQQLLSQGISVNPDLQGSAPYIVNFADSLIQHKPLLPGQNAADPMSYAPHADYMFQFAARYGNEVVPPSLLKLKADQQALSGLQLIQYLENWNEPDKWWFGREGYFNPFEFAAMCSADYDGHEGSMGNTKGMKNADPSIKMVMGGLASLNLEYLKGMLLWSRYHRNSGFPADVINVHHYSNNGMHGISPEEDNLKQKLEKLVDFRNRYLPGKEIWLSEFGYDTNIESPQASLPIGNNDEFEVQAQWILRSYLAAAAAGIDRAHVFMLRDVNAPNPNIYNSSGLTGELWFGHQPKKSWFYVHTMKNQLQGLRFDKILETADNKVNAYQFNNSTNDTIVIAVWCNTSEDMQLPQFAIEPEIAKTQSLKTLYNASLITPVSGDTLGQTEDLTFEDNFLRVDITERPKFIRLIRNTSASISIDLKLFGDGEPNVSLFPLSSFCVSIYGSDGQITGKEQCKPQQTSFIFDSLPVGIEIRLILREKTQDGMLNSSWWWNQWSGITALDALIINYMTVLHPITQQLAWIGESPFNPVFYKVADINGSGTLTALDALILMYRSVGWAGTKPFPGGVPDFTMAAAISQQAPFSIWPNPPETLLVHNGIFAANTADEDFFYELIIPALSPGNNYLNIYFIPTGDVNSSFSSQ